VNYDYSKLEHCIHYWRVVCHLRTHTVPLVPSVDKDKANQIGIFPPYSTSKFLARNVLELAAYSMPKEDWATLSDQPCTRPLQGLCGRTVFPSPLGIRIRD